ncbi:MAG TPA: hypothetical protein PKE52_14055, partial [Bacteroidales bacterium]|nr:hypothetical protein [Bacteroidales bacterium]
MDLSHRDGMVHLYYLLCRDEHSRAYGSLEAFVVGPQFDTQGNPIIQTDDSGVNRQLTYTIDYLGADPVNNADHWDGGRGGKYLMDGIGGTM